MNTLGNITPESQDSAFGHMKNDYKYPDWYTTKNHKFYNLASFQLQQ